MAEAPPSGSAAFLLRRWSTLPLGCGAVVGVGLQVGHLGEHVGQVASWVAHPAEPPWMSPLGHLVHLRAMNLGLTPPEATEAMHLAGNAVFLGGLSCLWRDSCHRCAALGHRRVTLLRRAWTLRAAHCLEHLALTMSAVLAGRPIGLSTGFGLLPVGPGLWSYRVWWHFIANLVPLVLIAAALLSPGAARRLPPARGARLDPATPGAAGHPVPARGRGG